MKTGDTFDNRIDMHLMVGTDAASIELYTITAGDPVLPDEPDETPFYENTGLPLMSVTLEVPGADWSRHVANDWVAINGFPDNPVWSTAHDGLDAALAQLPAEWVNAAIAAAFDRLHEVLA